jgi:hypothetical protein
MTPNQKADELIRKYYTWGINKEGQTLSWLEAKQCALIAVEEILKTYDSKDLIYPKEVNYWQEVKKEIEKL